MTAEPLSFDPLAFRAEVRAFLAGALTDDLRQGQRRTAGLYPDPSLSRRWHRILAERGWAAPLWPVQWGGTGWSTAQRFLFESECAQAGAPLIQPMGVRLAGPVIIAFGTEAQKAFYLPRIYRGDDYWCQGFSEPEAGSDLASLRTSAVRDGEDYLVNGSKIWTTHAQFATMMFLLARTSNEGRGKDGLSFLLVDMASPGVTIRPILSMSGEYELNQVFFDNVRVPVANRVGDENDGWRCTLHLLALERGAGIHAPRLRAMLARIGEDLERTADGDHHPLDDPLKAALFSETAVELDAFEMMEFQLLGRAESGLLPAAAAAMLKLRASRLKQSIAWLGVQLLGVPADPWCPEEALSDRAIADYLGSRAHTIFGGASEIQLGLIARQWDL